MSIKQSEQATQEIMGLIIKKAREKVEENKIEKHKEEYASVKTNDMIRANMYAFGLYSKNKNRKLIEDSERNQFSKESMIINSLQSTIDTNY